LYNEGLDLILGDFSEKANDARIELFWLRENWFGLKNIIENRLDTIRETAPEPLSKKEKQDIIKLAVAYAAQGDNEKMKVIKSDFFSRITDDKDLELIEYLTKGNEDLNYRDFENTLQMDKIERFLNNYSFLPSQDWEDIIEVLEPKVESLKGKAIGYK